MAIFANLKTSARVALVCATLIVMLVALVGASVMRMRELAADIDSIAASRVPKIVASTRSIEMVLQTSRQMRNALVLDAETEIRNELTDIMRNDMVLADAVAQLEKLLATDTEKNLFKAVRDAAEVYDIPRKKFVDLAQKGDYSSARDLMVQQVRQAEGRYIDALSTFTEFQAAESAAEVSAAMLSQERARTTTRLIVAVTFGAALFAMVASMLIVRSLRNRLGSGSYAARVAGAISDGDLSEDVHESAGDDAHILAAMKRMRADLAQTVGAIRRAADTVGVASGQIAIGNAQLASRTEEQASSLEETAASMEELAGTVKQNSDNARQAEALAVNAAKRAAQGGEEVAQMVATMNDISAGSKRIADITAVIDGIAFQTNILALNAAVEAARAGEQGRGFAVVASEVRSLAHRSAAAAKEIKALIGDSAVRVASGGRVVGQAGTTINALVGDVKQVSDLMRAIAEASAEQSRGVQQVNKTVTEMDRVVQQNASAAQESLAAAEAMRQQAETLSALVSEFKLPVQSSADPRKNAAPQQSAAPRAMVAAAPATATALPAPASDDWEQF
jgi:methyl-accepting chemotaxis protein